VADRIDPAHPPDRGGQLSRIQPATGAFEIPPRQDAVTLADYPQLEAARAGIDYQNAERALPPHRRSPVDAAITTTTIIVRTTANC
jgi:hypothetical protein